MRPEERCRGDLASSLDIKSTAAFAVFRTTPWTKLGEIQRGAREVSDEALAYLFRLYWKPAYRFLRQRYRQGHDRTMDMVQEFFAWGMETRFFHKADREIGSFRALLKTALKNFAMNTFRYEGRAKRGGQVAHVSLDWEGDEPRDQVADGISPEEILDRAWKEAILKRGLEQLRAALANEGQSERFEIFEEYYVQRQTQAAISQRRNMPLKTVENHIRKGRQRLVDILGEIVAETVTNTDDLRRELEELFG